MPGYPAPLEIGRSTPWSTARARSSAKATQGLRQPGRSSAGGARAGAQWGSSDFASRRRRGSRDCRGEWQPAPCPPELGLGVGPALTPFSLPAGPDAALRPPRFTSTSPLPGRGRRGVLGGGREPRLGGGARRPDGGSARAIQGAAGRGGRGRGRARGDTSPRRQRVTEGAGPARDRPAACVETAAVTLEARSWAGRWLRCRWCAVSAALAPSRCGAVSSGPAPSVFASPASTAGTCPRLQLLRGDRRDGHGPGSGPFVFATTRGATTCPGSPRSGSPGRGGGRAGGGVGRPVRGCGGRTAEIRLEMRNLGNGRPD